MISKNWFDANIISVNYKPPDSYGLDLEIIPMSKIRQRVSKNYLRCTEQIEFYTLIFITDGNCYHKVDFDSISCSLGSLLVLQPGQIHSFDVENNWNGWLIIFRPEFLMPKENSVLVGELELFNYLEELPIHNVLNKCEQQIVVECIARMYQDIQLNASDKAIHFLLRNQLQELINRLHIIRERSEKTKHINFIPLQRFKHFRVAVEKNFHHQHHVSSYIKYLACSEKSLNRSVRKFSGISAKEFVSKRIVLEAKRFLIHTELPISTMSDKLGFSESTNFIKFFKHKVGCSPGYFRKHHLNFGRG